ncbi:unnamed protein product [Adineta steineri]|uniref:F5/8 type C domain-containing protein n=1 Tax=Adineta steineri TaxID=433720 RepID=A0A819VHJ6_9BILA|nr:unnamed protein product [Adineta steineri]
MWQRSAIFSIIICIILYFTTFTPFISDNVQQIYITISHFNTRSEDYSSYDTINIGFSLFEFEQTKLNEIQLKHEYNLTAIVHYRKRLSYVKKMVKYLFDTQLFKEIIIWNSNPHINLTLQQINIDLNMIKFIRIINSKENITHKIKYLACSEANTSACFFIYDKWYRPYYIKSLIASFYSNPNTLHFISNYLNKEIDVLTSFSWTDYGCIFLSKYAEQHLNLINKYLIHDQNLLHLIDDLFLIWFNDISIQLNIDSQHHSSNLLYNESVVAIRKLQYSLQRDRFISNNTLFFRKQNHNSSIYVKSPSFNDRFIFFSNVLAIYDDHKVHDISFHNTWKAVDGNISTCWQTNRTIYSGDFFAIDFLYAQTNITFVLIVSHNRITQANLEMSISFNGIWWIPYESFRGQFNEGFKSFRYIKFKAINNHSNQSFQVCDIQMISKEKTLTNRQSLDM